MIVVDSTTNADVTLSTPFTATYAPPGSSTAQPLPGTGQVSFPRVALTRPPDRAKEALVTAGLVLLSALVPLGLLLGIVNRQRRLPRPTGRHVAVVPLLAADGTLRRADGTPLADGDLTPLRGDRDVYELPEGLHLARRRTWNPFAAACVEARSERGGVTAVPWMAESRDRVVEVPAAFGSLVLVRSDPGSDEGVAVVVTSPGDGAAEAEQALDRALAAANGISARVGEALAGLGDPLPPTIRG